MVDDQLLSVAVLDRLDAPHLRLLALVAGEPSTAPVPAGAKAGGMTEQDLRGLDAGLGDSLPVLLAALEPAGLVELARGTGGPARVTDATACARRRRLSCRDAVATGQYKSPLS